MQPRTSSTRHSVAPSDLEVLDMLCSMPSTFPHTGPSAYAGGGASSSSPSSVASPSSSSAIKSRPLSTLNALRRPPIDPMVLAASLSSGPHVTRHHFHHSFGSAQHAKDSKQMPASQRASLLNQQQRDEQQQHHVRPRKFSAASGSYANCDVDEFDSEPSSSLSSQVEPVPDVTDEERAMYASRQAPRSVRLQRDQAQLQSLQPQPLPSADRRTAGQREVQSASNIRASDEPARPELEKQPGNLAGKVPPPAVADGPASAVARALHERKEAVGASATPSLGSLPTPDIVSAAQSLPATPLNRPAISSIVRPPPLTVRCHARTRIPTPHGEIFCHLYRNNYDAKEHLAIVIDPAQNDEESVILGADGRPVRESSRRYRRRALRSKTLDEVWGPQESEMERIVRGAYVGRLGPSFQVPSQPMNRDARTAPKGGVEAEAELEEEEPPLVRIHSECFTGETIGSQRCDCGEQLDEAIRLISQGSSDKQSASGKKHTYEQTHLSSSALPPRGVIVYLRQEGRGIGLLDKLMAYNLQDMGHDTVSANILLGHLPDARKYDIASAILQDLGVGACRLLTNNPEKMEALEAEGVRVTERVGMVPRVWKYRKLVSNREKAKAKATAAKAKAKAKKERQSSGKASSTRQKAGGDHDHSSKGKQEASPLRAALLRQRSDLVSGGASMDASMISQAASISTSDDDADPVTLGLRHQGEEVRSLSSSPSSSSSTASSDLSDPENDDADADADEEEEYINSVLRKSGATMIGGSITKSEELDRYLRTKVERMGHLLSLPPSSEEDGGRARPSAPLRSAPKEDEAVGTGMISQPNSEDEGNGGGV